MQAIPSMMFGQGMCELEKARLVRLQKNHCCQTLKTCFKTNETSPISNNQTCNSVCIVDIPLLRLR